jgi:hypothetical protein
MARTATKQTVTGLDSSELPDELLKNLKRAINIYTKLDAALKDKYKKYKNENPLGWALKREIRHLTMLYPLQIMRIASYTPNMDAVRSLKEAAISLGFNRDVVEAIGETVANAVREATEHASSGPRQLWTKDRKPGETPGEFIKRAYARELAAGELHKGIIHHEDAPLYRVLFKPGNTPDFDLPTKAEWNDRRLKEAGGRPSRSADLRLYEVAVKRRVAGARPE